MLRERFRRRLRGMLDMLGDLHENASGVLGGLLESGFWKPKRV